MMSGFDQQAAGWDQVQMRHDRARAVADAILTRRPGSLGRVLDFGCGTGLLGFALADRATTVDFADPSPAMRQQTAAKLVPGIPGVVLDPGELTGPYDLIASLMVLHHIENIPEVLGRLAGLLAPGGVLALADLDLDDGSFHPDEVVPHNGFDRVVLQRHLNAVGLEVFSSTTPFVVPKLVATGPKLFPVFLLIARRIMIQH